MMGWENTIQNSLCRKKVLLVLDDVNELNQLENLAGTQDWFGPGSRVLITTRDKHLLMTHGVHKTYEVGMIFPNEALNLFSLKAFKGDQPQEGYLDLSKEVVDYTGGLPLALEVLGSYLYGRNVDIWNSAIKKIKSVPHPKIQDKLKISYESLDSLEKDKAFSKTSQLKFLSLCEMQLPLGLSCLPCSLKVLHWRGCPLKTPPLTTQLDEVADIKLSHSKVEQLWKGIKVRGCPSGILSSVCKI
jgi:hypothetical protein